MLGALLDIFDDDIFDDADDEIKPQEHHVVEASDLPAKAGMDVRTLGARQPDGTIFVGISPAKSWGPKPGGPG